MQVKILQNEGQKYCNMIRCSILLYFLTCIKVPHGFNTYVLSTCEWLLKTDLNVVASLILPCKQMSSSFTEESHQPEQKTSKIRIFAMRQCADTGSNFIHDNSKDTNQSVPLP